MSIEVTVGLIIGFLTGIVLMCFIMSIKRPKKNELVEELRVFKRVIDKKISYLERYSRRYGYNKRLY